MEKENSSASRHERSLDEVLSEFLISESYRSERAVAWVRVALCVMFSARLLFLVPERSLPRCLSGDSGALTMQAFLWMGVLVSFYSLRELRKSAGGWWSRRLSVILDFVVTYGALGPWIVWPVESYRGFFFMPEGCIIVLVLVAAALRLSRAAFLVALLVSALGNVIFLSLDLYLNQARIAYDVTEMILVACLYLAGVLIAALVLVRTKHLVFEGAKSAQHFERAHARMGTFLSAPLADELLKTGELKLGGKRCPVAILFSDLRGFTTYSETHEPKALVRELNAYMEVMIEVIHQQGGVVDKFIGDAIMAVFGAPEQGDNDAAAAIRAAHGMREALVEHNKVREEHGLQPLRQGVGVHFGDVVAGNMGAQDRMSYTVLGDVVNAASRLESSTKELGVEVLISEATIQAAQKEGAEELPAFKEIGDLSLKGKEQGVHVYTLD
jgi:class 3 adenylate cyclase